MNVSEFEQWLENYCAAFPSTAAWLNDLGDVRVTTIDHWLNALEPCAFEDALEVTKRIFRGDDEAIKAYDRENTPAHIRRLCEAQANRRTWTNSGTADTTSPDYVHPNRTAPGQWSMSESLKAIRKGLVTGDNLGDLAKRFIPAGDPQREPRYRCLRCRDSGRVFCWHPRSMHLARLGEFIYPRDCRVCELACDCSTGQRFTQDGFRLLFDAKRWLPCKASPTRENFDELLVFMQTYTSNTVTSWDQFERVR